MPSKLVAELMDEVKELRIALEVHLREGGQIKADILWLKWLVMGIAGGIGVIAITLLMK